MFAVTLFSVIESLKDNFLGQTRQGKDFFFDPCPLQLLQRNIVCFGQSP
ncbi:hypothetical protein SGRA_0004 [Saprospira grandis str. Lewin]|uniref:Uncharacterized protein n=1 Tax=Saprospira grandis (strain Lewin) TaxID=984262 RepID=H6L3R4_SAPGL|nr:hypothetical protein SGRA_0004 [Saprospira grandis str. Lewin]